MSESASLSPRRYGVSEPFSGALPQGSWWPFAQTDSRQISWPTGPNGSPLRQHFIDTAPEGGPESPLVCVHGNPTWSYYWKGLIESQRSERRCIALDHVGCGWSDRPNDRRFRLAQHIDHLVRLIDALDLERITLAVHDWGGAIGIGAALRRIERIERLIVFNTGAFPPPFIPFRIRVCRWPVFGPAALLGANAFSRAALRMAVARRDSLSADERRGLLAPYDSPSRRIGQLAFVRDIPLTPSHPTWQTLTEIEQGLPSLSKLPIALIWGMQDWCFDPRCLKRFVDVWPGAEVHRLEDVGHYVVLEGAARVHEIVDRFFERTTAR